MPMDEIIRGIERTDVENMPDVLKVVLDRYRELYPEWELLYFAVQRSAMDEQSIKLRQLIVEAERIMGITRSSD